MELSTPVLASLLGAIVAGVISGVINITSLAIQYMMNEKHQRNITIREWKRETNGILQELKRSAVRFDPSNDSDSTEVIEELVDSVEDQKSIIPHEIESQELESALTDVILTHERIQIDDYYDSLFEYRGDLISKTENALNELDDLS